MAAEHKFTQEPHKLLVIPGPIEVSDDVLYANAHPSMSHVSPDFIPVLGDCIRMTREILYTTTGQPFLIAGSGTLGWDQVSSNLVEPGENALVLHTGYFGDSFAECLEVYGANVDQLKAKIGAVSTTAEIENALRAKKYKIVTITHVDTSTGVLSDARGIAETVRRVSPDTLVALDAVCSVASEEIQFDAWGLDVVLTASQKGLGTPPGLSILVASQRAIKVWETRKAPPTSFYASWKKWLPIMRAYEAGNAMYFATPPVQLIYAFHASLSAITKGSPSLEHRFAAHKEAARRVRAAGAELGLKTLALEEGFTANGMTALYFPEGLSAADVIPRLGARGVIVAAGLHKEIKDKYFRIGHMGVTVVEPSRGDIDRIVSGLKEVIAEARAAKNA
ncbi:PLP-dependent transferase [Punctularia strigosozonata HHB-11173 SS5]|uniref:PLP-dependent transferase n=1 Tax=Punctularia strigosozonata (strain HHB-11173) TaxID=741275 RepID=UPI0004418700|nr:PLP-dependent transferase [Punctularia strigosozonata HHB-11173 SS5]EIN06153.1 PLP-dependent transferase [Punctularia strigosozonata HHB-11173 SS5]